MKPITTAELIAAYTAGASVRELARRYPLCRTSILYRLRRAGVTMRRKGAPRGNQNARIGRLKRNGREVNTMYYHGPEPLPPDPDDPDPAPG